MNISPDKVVTGELNGFKPTTVAEGLDIADLESIKAGPVPLTNSLRKQESTGL